MFCPRFSDIFFNFYFFENAWKLQQWSVFSKVKTLHKYYPTPIGSEFSTKFYSTQKYSGFWNISNLGDCYNHCTKNKVLHLGFLL